MNKRSQITAAVCTVVVAVLVMVLLRVAHICYVPQEREWPPRHEGEVALMPEEEFVEVVQESAPVAPSREEAAPAKADKPAKSKSTPAPATGHDTSDKGKAADAPSTVTSKKPSAVKETVKPEPKQVGPSKEEIEKQKQEEARRKASSATASAFQKSNGKNNTEAKGDKEGDTGSPDGASRSVNGSGSGTVGGGWSLPHYAKVPATMTGSIKMKVTVDRSGAATRVDFIGGDAPAATDTRLRRAVEKEVKSRRFTRGGDDAPDAATAYITYVFR